MACHVKIYFVNTCEVVNFTISENIRSPYATLQRIVGARGLEQFSAAWADDYNSFYPLKSDRGFADALRSRSHHLNSLRIFVKEARPHGEAYGARGYHQQQASFPGPRQTGPREGSQSPWSGHKVVGPKERMTDIPRMPRPAKVLNSSAMLPKDPSLAELVDKVRHNLDDLAASMHSSQSSSSSSSSSADQENCPPVVVERTGKPVSLILNTTVPESVKMDDGHCVKGSVLPVVAESGLLLSELLEEFAEEEALLREVPRSRAESSLSDFLVITPSTDSCVHFSMEDFEAAISELDSDDTFEIVDVPDDFDSDIDWKEIEGY